MEWLVRCCMSIGGGHDRGAREVRTDVLCEWHMKCTVAYAVRSAEAVFLDGWKTWAGAGLDRLERRSHGDCVHETCGATSLSPPRQPRLDWAITYRATYTFQETHTARCLCARRARWGSWEQRDEGQKKGYTEGAGSGHVKLYTYAWYVCLGQSRGQGTAYETEAAGERPVRPDYS